MLIDLRYALRMLLRSPGFSALIVLTLALGIGANSAIFSVVNGVLLRSLPYAHPERLVRVFSARGDASRDSWSGPNYLDYKAQQRVFDYMSAYVNLAFTMTGRGDAERVSGDAVSYDFFEMFGVKPQLGRTFLSEGSRATHRMVMLNQRYWRKRFGGDPGIVGQTLILNDQAYTVAGVTPAGFESPTQSDIWTLGLGDVPESPFGADRELEKERGAGYLNVIGRMKAGATLEQARAEMATISRRLAAQYPNDDAGAVARVVMLRDDMVRDSRTPLILLLCAVALVLLIACANIANLLLTRSTARQRELTVRAAMGADRARLIRQMLTESTLLAVIGGALGLVLAVYAVGPLKALTPQVMQELNPVRIDAGVLAFTLGIALLCGLVFGIAPALQVSAVDMASALRAGSRSNIGGRHVVRTLLVVSQVALSMLLLVGSGLLIRSLMHLQAVPPGYDTQHVLTVSLPVSQQISGEKQTSFYQRLTDNLQGAPGVVAAGAVFPLPLTGGNAGAGFAIEGRPLAKDKRLQSSLSWATPGYFRAMGIPRVAGRSFGADDKLDAPPVVVVSQTFARKFFGAESPIGHRLKLSEDPSDTTKWSAIVGVVGDVRLEGLDAPPEPQIYLAHLQNPWPYMTLVVRSAGAPSAVLGSIKREVSALNPSLPLSKVQTMEAVIGKSVAEPRFRTLLLSAFAALALILAAIGIYGVISFSVTQRTREIGVRMALGARPEDVLAMVVQQGIAPALMGVFVGLIAALLVTRIMKSMLFGVTATDPLTFIVVPIVLAAVAFVACWLPARKATRVSPLIALRAE